MRHAVVLFSSLCVLLAIEEIAAGDEPAPGKTVIVTCEGNAAQRYSCYVPKAYSPKKAWPILYCFSPNATGNAFVERYRDVCEERGWIVVGSMNSKNGPWGPIQEAMDAMWADCERRFTLSKTMRYASGFSGGARVSFALAEMKPAHIGGVLAIGAGLSSTARGALPRKELAVFIVCGETDFNRKEIEALVPRLKENGNPIHFETFPGAHTMPPVPLMEKAVRWADDQAVERKQERFRKAIDAAAAAREAGEPVNAWLGLVDALERYSEPKALRAEAVRLRKALERMADVKPEVKAMKAYERANGWIEKNRTRFAESKFARDQALKKLRAVVDGHAGTRAAGLAEAKLAELADTAD